MKTKLTEWLVKPLTEDINIPVNVGDTILTGRFKNKKTVVKSIGKDKHGMPTINGRKVATFRIQKDDSDEQLEEKAKRDYKAEYKKFQSSKKAKKYRAELNKYNRQKGTYGNGDKKDASHKGGKIVGYEAQSKNRGRREKSRLKKEEINENKISLNVPSDIRKIHKLFKKNRKQLYIVGGAVRDAILGKKPKDFDLATDAKPDEVLKIAKKGGMKTYEVGKQFGVVVVGGHEIATFRKDIGKGRRPKSVDFSDIQGDVKRRDLTINAMFYDIERNEVVDLTGGLEDIKKRIVRTVGKASQRFDEDPLRKLRAVRFQAVIGGTIDKDTSMALKRNPSLKGVSRERVREEFIKGIQKGKSSSKFMEALDYFGFTKQIFPQLNITKPYPNVKSFLLFLATILRKNKLSKVVNVLNKLKYSNEEIRNISFLIYLNSFKPDDIYIMKKSQEKTTLSRNDIKIYGKLVGKDFTKFANFNLSVKGGGPAFVGLKGKEIGDKIKELEKLNFLNESVIKEDDKEPKFHSVHRTSSFEATFGRWYANYLPLSTKKIQSILGKEKVSVFHVGNAEYERDIKQVQRIVGKKGTLSTFTSVDKGEKLAKGKGIQSGGGIIYQIEGTLLVASTRDMQSMPDNTGRRWIAIQDLAGKVAGGKMYKELKSAVESNKMDRQSWMRIERKIEDKWMKKVDYYGDDYEGGYERKEKELKKLMGPIKRKWIKKYIDMGYKIINKYKPQIKRHILSQKDKPSQHGWNEILVNQIKVKDIFLLKRSDYPNIRKAAEKIATGKVTVGSPAQFRKWYNQRGGIINETKKEMLNYPHYLKNVGNVPQNNPDGEHRYYDPDLEEQDTKIKKVVGIYGGRFQPFGPHHFKTYKWLKSQVDDVYITTSDIKKPPRHPMNYSEKVRHMVKMGVPKNKIIKEKTPYVANNTLKKFDKDTTAVVYIFGKKDAGRLKGGTKKGGGKTYYQDFKKNKKNLKGYEEHGYILTAPHQSIKVGGQEVSGTVMRNLLGSPKVKKEERPKLFKQAFGYYDKGVYNMMTNKFKKLFETFDLFLVQNDFKKILEEGSNTNLFPIDDGPPTYYDGFSDYKKHSKEWIDSMYSGMGWELVSYILGKNANDPGLDYTTRMGKVPTVAYGRKGAGPYGERFPSEDPIKAYKKWLERVCKGLDYTILKWMGLNDSASDVKGIPVEAPALPGVQTQDQNTQRAVELDLAPGDEEKSDMIKRVQESFMKDIDILLEGGAYGHMSHPFDDNNLTFSDLKMIVINGIGGKLDREDGVTEKLDGQNLMVSWIDGKLRAARNKGHLKNFGKTAPDTKGVKSIFKGRGNIEKAFVGAMKDLEKSIGSLSDKQKTKIFDNGKKWMNLEVMYPATANVVDYDVAEIVFHGTLEYDESGRPIGQPKDSARMLAGMIKQTNNHIQKMFKIGKPNFLKVPKVQNFGKKKSMYLGKIKKLQSEYGLSDKDTLGMYHESYWREYIYNASKQFGVKLKPTQFAKLVTRWAYFDKGYKIANIKKDYKENPKFLEWILKTDKLDHNRMFKQNIKPFEILFFQVGTEILKNISGYMAVNPDKTIQKMRKEMISAMKDLQKPDKIEKLKKLKTQIEKLQKIGGLDAIVPSEGIVFKYKGKVYKFTGAFAPINQILGSIKFG